MVRQLVFTYALAIMINKLGDRNNNEKIQSAGRYKFMELFYGFNHPIYREIEFRDLRQKVVMFSIVTERKILHTPSLKISTNIKEVVLF